MGYDVVPETAKTEQKPDSIKVISFIFIIVSVLIIYSVISGLLSYDPTQMLNTPPADRPFLFSFISEQFVPLALLQITIGVITFIASVQFYRFKPWARTALEIITWCLLLYIISLGAFTIYTWTIAFSFMDSGALVGIITWSSAAVIFSLPPVFLIRALRGKRIRTLFMAGAKPSD